MAVGFPEGVDELADAAAAGEQFFDQGFHFREVAAVPLRRNLVGGGPDGVGGQGFEAGEPGLEGVPAGDGAVDVIAVVDAAQGCIFEASSRRRGSSSRSR